MKAPINEITIIVLFYEEKTSLIFRCLENIKNFKIIIVDNAGNISLKKKVQEKFKIYKYILNKKNYGYTKAANQAIRQCDTEYILMFQPDALMSNEDILILLESHKKYEDCFMTSPTSYDEESKLSYSSGYLPEKNNTKDILNFSSIFFLRSAFPALSIIMILKFLIFSKHRNTRFVFSS